MYDKPHGELLRYITGVSLPFIFFGKIVLGKIRKLNQTHQWKIAAMTFRSYKADDFSCKNIDEVEICHDDCKIL